MNSRLQFIYLTITEAQTVATKLVKFSLTKLLQVVSVFPLIYDGDSPIANLTIHISLR